MWSYTTKYIICGRKQNLREWLKPEIAGMGKMRERIEYLSCRKLNILKWSTWWPGCKTLPHWNKTSFLRWDESKSQGLSGRELGEMWFPRLEYLYMEKSFASRTIGWGSCSSYWMTRRKHIKDGSEFKMKFHLHIRQYSLVLEYHHVVSGTFTGTFWSAFLCW